MKHQKAQIFSLDILLAILIFIGTLLMIVNLWNFGIEKNILNEERNELEQIARNAASLLLVTEGNPGDWVSSADSIGLGLPLSQNQANSSYKSRPVALGLRGSWVLDASKIIRFQTMNYTDSKNYLGLLSTNEHYYLTIFKWNGAEYTQVYAIGSYPDDNTTLIVNVERLGILDRSWARLNLKIWQECEGVICD